MGEGVERVEGGLRRRIRIVSQNCRAAEEASTRLFFAERTLGAPSRSSGSFSTPPISQQEKRTWHCLANSWLALVTHLESRQRQLHLAELPLDLI